MPSFRLRLLLAVAVLGGGLVVGVQVAEAHQCPDPYEPNDPACEETPVYDDWRPNYVPLFDLSEREYGNSGSAEEQRRDAQRWREECRSYDQDGNVEERQQCAWVYGGQSIQKYDESDPDDAQTGRPNELHVGFGASHCFLAEGAHDCDAHGDDSEFATHDSHGGALYVDVCLAENPDSKWCDDGVEDTQAGVTAVDHLTCLMGCLDEYHVVRPFDTDYTERQMDNSVHASGHIVGDPVGHVCGYEDHTACPGGSGGGEHQH